MQAMLWEWGERFPDDCSPAQEMDDISLDDVAAGAGEDLCPACREEMGILNLLGFGM
jgi:hypothetical protein